MSCNYGIWNFQRKNRFFYFLYYVWNIRKFVGDLISNCVIIELLKYCNYGFLFSVFWFGILGGSLEI